MRWSVRENAPLQNRFSKGARARWPGIECERAALDLQQSDDRCRRELDASKEKDRCGETLRRVHRHRSQRFATRQISSVLLLRGLRMHRAWLRRHRFWLGENCAERA